MTSETKADYIRSDELADAAVRVSDLPRLFNVSDRTIREWIKIDEITTFEHPVQNATGARQLAVRWGDIPSTSSDTTRWKRR